MVLAKERFNIRERQLEGEHIFVPFSATTRMSGLDFDGRQIRKGAAESVKQWVRSSRAARCPTTSTPLSSGSHGPGPLLSWWPTGREILGVIELKDVVKSGHPGEVRRDALDGHPHGDDHR